MIFLSIQADFRFKKGEKDGGGGGGRGCGNERVKDYWLKEDQRNETVN